METITKTPRRLLRLLARVAAISSALAFLAFVVVTAQRGSQGETPAEPVETTVAPAAATGLFFPSSKFLPVSRAEPVLGPAEHIFLPASKSGPLRLPDEWGASTLRPALRPTEVGAIPRQ